MIRKELAQWFFRTTRYAEELLDFSKIDWPERVQTLQSRWIGRSEGASVVFRTESGEPIEVFTTRPDTIWGATFLVLAPEHPLVAALTTPERGDEVRSYVETAAAPDRHPARGRRQGEDRRLHRRLRDQPGQAASASRSGSPTTC